MDETGAWDHHTHPYTFTKKTDPAPFIKEAISQNRRDTFAVTLNFPGEMMPIFGIHHKPPRYSRRLINNQHQQVLIDKKIAGMNICIMKEWVEQFLHHSHPGDVLVMDNLCVHHNSEILDTLKRGGIIVKFLPAYSASQLSPLDNCFFAQLKRKIQGKVFPTFEQKKEEVRLVCESISPETIRGFFHKCGIPHIDPLQNTPVDFNVGEERGEENRVNDEDMEIILEEEEED